MRSSRFNIISNLSIRADAFSSRYKIYLAECKAFKDRENLCDLVRPLEGVISVRNDADRVSIHILTDCSVDTEKRILEKIYKDSELRTKYTFKSISLDNITQKDVFQLMLNSLSSSSVDEMSNASGRFFVVNHIIEHPKYPGIESQVVTLEFKVTNAPDYIEDGSFLIKCDVRSFTNTVRKGEIDFQNKKYESYAQYKHTSSGMQRCTPSESGKSFIIRKTRWDKKNNIDFFDLSEKGMPKTKTAVLQRVLDNLKNKYHGILSFELGSCEIEHVIEIERSSEIYLKRLSTIFTKKRINIHNKAGKKYNILCEDMCKLLKNYQIEVNVTDQIEFDALNIYVIHDPEYYAATKITDPYKQADHNTSQHVTVESIIPSKKNHDSAISCKIKKAQMEVLLEELAIKDDINNHVMRFYEWTSLDHSGSYTFGLPIEEKIDGRVEPIAFALLTIHPDGRMDFNRHEFFDADVDDRLSSSGTWNNTEYVVMDPMGNVNIVRKTDMIPIPPISAIKEKIADNMSDNTMKKPKRTRGIRDVAGRSVYLSECVDINVIKVSDNIWMYYVGAVGLGVGSRFNHAANVREIVPFQGSRLFFNEILGLMNVPFVRHNQSTVVPFPLKYLREWMKMRP